MRIRWEPASRWPRWPLWAVALVGAWAVLVAASVALSRHAGEEVSLCLFKMATGEPCLTCGSTRGVLALLAGDPVAAWWFNPLVFTALGLWLVHLAARLASGRRLNLHLTSRRERILVWALTFAVMAGNWAYVVVWVG